MMAVGVRPNRFGDIRFKGRFFLDDAEYGGTNHLHVQPVVS